MLIHLIIHGGILSFRTLNIDMDNPIKTGDKSKDSWFNTYQGNFALLSEDLELSKENLVNSNGETVNNVYYVKTM